jgi:hypothetical protein
MKMQDGYAWPQQTLYDHSPSIVALAVHVVLREVLARNEQKKQSA